MNFLKSIIEEEQHRLMALKKKYQSEILSLPRGSISIKKRNKKKYIYLAVREKEKVKFQYIGPALSQKPEDIIQKIQKRKDFEEKLKKIKKDLMEIEKVLHGKKI
jgi:hypothetical protein